MKLYQTSCALLCLIGAGIAISYSNNVISAEPAQVSQLALPADINPDTGNRLSPVNREEMDDFGKELYDSYVKEGLDFDEFLGPGPRGIRMNSPRVAEYMTTGNQYLRYKAGLDPKLMELTVLLAARDMDNKYEWLAHEKSGLKAGLAQEVIDVVRYSRPVPAKLGDEEKVIIELSREILKQHKVSSDTYARALTLFGKRKLIDIVTLLGHYTATAMLLTAFDQQLHPGDVSSLPELSE